MINSKFLNLVLCQFDSSFQKIDKNMEVVEKFLSKYNNLSNLDIILLPEMAFTGYCYKSQEQIEQFTEICEEGPIFQFISKQAQRLNCYIACGYAEKVTKNDSTVFYNSAYLIQRDGKLQKNFRKHHLYEQDHYWAKEGEKFQTTEIVTLSGETLNICLAICMDINCYEFKDPSQFELAQFCKKENVDIVFLICAWLDSEKLTEMDLINYWVNRMQPLINKKKNKKGNFHKWWLVVNNRIGVEDKVKFCGTSCVVECNPIKLVSYLKKEDSKDQYVQIKIN